MACRTVDTWRLPVMVKPLMVKMCSGSEAGSYLRLIDSCITQLKAQGPSRTCNESKEEGQNADGQTRVRRRKCSSSSSVGW